MGQVTSPYRGLAVAYMGIFLLLPLFLGLRWEDVPNPQVERKSFVQDSAGILDAEWIRAIDQISQELEKNTGIELRW